MGRLTDFLYHKKSLLFDRIVSSGTPLPQATKNNILFLFKKCALSKQGAFFGRILINLSDIGQTTG